MNSPDPVGKVNVPAVTPSTGAALGALAALLVHTSNPVVGGVVATLAPTLGAWLAHWLHSKLGTPE